MSLSELFEAIKKSDFDELVKILDTGISVLQTDNDKNTILHIAADEGNLEITKLLVQKGTPIDSINYLNATPLCRAAQNGYLEIVKYLCESGATTYAPDLNPSPLIGAATMGHLEVVKYLIEIRHVPVNHIGRPFAKTALYAATEFRQLEVVRYLMAMGADPNIRDNHGETAIDCVQGAIKLSKEMKASEEEMECLKSILKCLRRQDASPSFSTNLRE